MRANSLPIECFAYICMLCLSINANAHSQTDTTTAAALLRHVFSAPDHVAMLVAALCVTVVAVRYRLSSRSKTNARREGKHGHPHKR